MKFVVVVFFFLHKLKKSKTSDEIVDITMIHPYFSKKLQRDFFLLLFPHRGNQLRHHSGIQNSELF